MDTEDRAAEFPSQLGLESERHFMGEALREAHKAWKAEEVPIGAVIVYEGKIIGRAHNQVETLKDATAHAEMLAITQAESQLNDWRLNSCDLYVTKEPCLMCAGAIVLARLRRVIFGCSDLRGGGAGGRLNLLQLEKLNHQCAIVSGIRSAECTAILKDFFTKLRTGDF